MTLAVLRRNVAAKLGLDNTAASGDQVLIDSWLGEAYEDILLKTHCKVRPATMNLTASTDSYSLPTQILAIKEIENTASSQRYAMEQLILPELQKKRRATGTAPARYWAIAGDLLELFPAPGSGEVLSLWYVPRPTAMSASSDTPSDIPAEYHKLVELYACAEGGEFTQHQASEFGSYYRGLYEKGLMEMRRGLNRRAGAQTPRAKVGYPSGRVGVARNNDQDIIDYW